MKRRNFVFAALTAWGAIWGGAHAQGAYPNKPVKFVVPFPAGAGVDLAGRVVGKALSELWGQTVFIENRPGAGGQIGSQAVAKAAPDGYTFMVHSNAHSSNVALYKNVPYDPAKDFIDVALLGYGPFVMITAEDSPYKDVAALVAAAKAAPGKLAFASAGIGSATHFSAELFLHEAKIEMLHVPFKGSPEAITDVISGRTTFYIAPAGTVGGLLKGGKLRALGMSTAERFDQLPDIPTVAEQGVPNFQTSAWIGLWAPAATPAAVTRKVHDDIERVLRRPDVIEQLAKAGFAIRSMTSADFGKFVNGQTAMYKMLVKAANIPLQ